MRTLWDLRSGERRPALSAFFALFGITAGHTLLETARDALFLAKLPASRLPWMYLAIAAVGLTLATLARRARPSRSGAAVPLSLFVSAAVTVGLWSAASSPSPLLVYALYIWSGIFASWVIVQFWMLLGRTFDVGQAKRLYGFIGAGSVLGAVAGAAAARAVAGAVAARHLLLCAALLFVLTAVGPALAMKVPPSEERDPTAPAGARSLGQDLAVARHDPYLVRILLLVLLSTVALTAVDYLFKAAVAARVPKEDLARYFASVSVVLNALALVVQVAAVGPILRIFGVHRALWVLPVLMLVGAGGVVLGGGLALALALKGADGALRHSLHRTSAELLYVPIPDVTRSRIKPLIDLVGQRGGQAVASLGILGLVALGAGEAHMGGLVAILAAAWLAVAASVRGHYLDVFRSTLREGRLENQGDLPELDLAALEALFAALNSRKDAEVIAALDLLAAQSRQRLIPALILYHPSKAIVVRALELFTRERRDDFLPITDRLLVHPDPEVRAAALRARTSVEPDESFLRARLHDPCPEVRATALVSLVAREVMTAEEGEHALLAFAEDPSPAVRIALAQAIAAEPSPRFAATLVALAGAPEPEVQGAAAGAMERAAMPELIPVLLGLLGRRAVRSAARQALAALGEPALAALDAALSSGEHPPFIRWAMPRAITEFPRDRAAEVLSRHLSTTQEGMLRFRVLVALRRIRAEAPDLVLDGRVLTRVAEETARAAYRLLDWRVAFARALDAEPSRNTPASQLLATMLRDKQTHAVQRLFMLFGLLHPTEDFDRIHRGLGSKLAKTRASSRELCESFIAAPLRDAVLILVDDLPDASRLERAAPFYVPTLPAYAPLLAAFLQRRGDLASLATYHAAELGLTLGAASMPVADTDSALTRALHRGLTALRRAPVAHA